MISPSGFNKATEFVVRVPDVDAEPAEYVDISDGSFGRVELEWLFPDGGEA